MRLLAGIGGAAVLVVVLWDAFETIVLPRRVSRRLRLTRLFYGATWRPWAASARLVRNGNRRELYLSFYGPLSLVLLLALWAAGLVAGFGLLQYANGSAVQLGTETGGLSTDLYLSCTTRGRGRPRARWSCCGGTAAPAAWRRWSSCCANGSTGRRRCWRVTFPTRCSPTSARSITISHGFRRSRPCWTPARS